MGLLLARRDNLTARRAETGFTLLGAETGFKLVWPSMDPMGTASIRDVARRAGVSPATVSRVLNGSARVTDTRRERVERAIEDLGFRPSSLARGLSLGRTGTLGVIAPFFTHWGTIGRLRGITDATAAADYDLMIFNVETPKQRADALLKFARRDRVDGLLVLSVPLEDDDAAQLWSERLPVVVVDIDRPELSRVTIDDVAGGRLATEHLLERGHRRIGFVGDVADTGLGFTVSDRRHRGYLEALAAAGVGADPGLTRLGAYGRDGARASAVPMLAAPDRPSAIFAASDMQAVGVLDAAGHAGLRVPDDLAVVGFDDIEIADVLGLTTVRQPLADIGAEAVNVLLAELRDGKRAAVEIVKPLELVPRRTT
jgi:DNA-binding LacI/PurR family transcriptional regulator